MIDTETYSYIDKEQEQIFRGRHFASLHGELQIGTKCDWARSQVAQVRNHHAHLRAWTTAKQAESIAHGFRFALRRKDPEARNEAISRLKNWIYIDTRSKLGYPKKWAGMPVVPQQGARAYFVRLPVEEWQLQIDAGGIPRSFLENLRGEHFLDSPCVQGSEWPWWCVNGELGQYISAHSGSPAASKSHRHGHFPNDDYRKEVTQWFD